MSKFAAAVAIGVGGASAAAGGVYLSGIFNVMDATLPETLEEFKSKGSNGCVTHLFPKLTFTDANQGTAINSSSKVDASTFSTETSPSGSSCLTVNWKKDSFSDTNSP